MGDLHSLRLTSRTRSKDDVVVVISLDWMGHLVAGSLNKSFMDLL